MVTGGKSLTVEVLHKRKMVSTKGGYDCEFVEPPHQCLECSICLLTLREPHVSSCCGNHFCRPCISRVLDNKNACPLCNEREFTTLLHKGVQRTINSLIIYCQWKRLGCNWKGELGHLAEHLEPRDGATSGCGLVMVECSYKCGTMIERRGLMEHQNNVCTKRPVEAQMASLAAKIEQRLTIVEKRLETELKERQDTKEKLSTLEKQNETLLEENEALKSELQAIKDTTTLHAFDTPPFYYTVHNFNHYKTADLVLFSPPFYSHPGGYKLRLQLYPNGTKYAKNKFVSLFVAILRGEHDGDLQWPFEGMISVEIFNTTKNIWDLSTDFTLASTESNRCVKRPVNCVGNDGSGTITWLSHDTLTSDYIIPGYDCVRFRVTEVQLNQ